MTDEVGNKVRSTEYDPFGNWRVAKGQANIQMLYQGQQQDPESNLYYLRARYYDPATGRFISRDPVKGYLTNPLTQNGYDYANGNPINLSDPLGLWTVDVNFSASIGFAGLTDGLLISDKGIYVYAGIGVASPGLGGAVYYSPDDPTTGMSTQENSGAIIGKQKQQNTSDGSSSEEWGLTTPGVGAYTVQTNPLICF